MTDEELSYLGMGYLPDPEKKSHEPPDWQMARLMQARPFSAPLEAVDYSHNVQGVFNQGRLGSCTAQAIHGALMCKQNMDGIPTPKVGDRRTTYWGARAYIETTEEDSGAHLRDGFRFINVAGFQPEEESALGYDISKFMEEPTDEEKSRMYDQMNKGQGQVKYYRITESSASRQFALRMAMTNKGIPVLGTDTTMDFLRYSGGILPKPAEDATRTGGHAFYLCGYTPDYVIGVNSWGIGWGESGFMRLSWDYIKWHRTRDIWIVDKAPYFKSHYPSQRQIDRELARQVKLEQSS